LRYSEQSRVLPTPRAPKSKAEVFLPRDLERLRDLETILEKCNIFFKYGKEVFRYSPVGCLNLGGSFFTKRTARKKGREAIKDVEPYLVWTELNPVATIQEYYQHISLL
jgi:hypothetical protein